MPWIVLALLLTTMPVEAGVTVPPFKGNDLGGIIAWSPATQKYRHDIAAAHCAGYGKAARITSVRARYGEYIGFACVYPYGYRVVHTVVRVRN